VRPAVWLAILVTAWLLVNLSSLWIEYELRILFCVFTMHEFAKLDPSLLYFDTEELYSSSRVVCLCGSHSVWLLVLFKYFFVAVFVLKLIQSEVTILFYSHGDISVGFL